MQILLKVALSVAIILLATAIAKKFPSLASLIAVMPLPGVLAASFGTWLLAAIVHQWVLR